MTAAWASVLAMIGARRGGFTGGLLAMAGLTLTVRAAMGRRDFAAARGCIERNLRDRGWRRGTWSPNRPTSPSRRAIRRRGPRPPATTDDPRSPLIRGAVDDIHGA